MTETRIKAVAFDLFGTLLEIRQPQNPYKKLLDAMQLSADERARARRAIMSAPVPLSAVGGLVGREVPSAVLVEAEKALYSELASVARFNDVVPTWNRLRSLKTRIAIASNLAYPYRVPAMLLLPFQPDVCAWSFEAGAIKPEPAFYAHLCHALDCHPSQVLMIGDRRGNDYEGAKAAGLQALHLNRREVSARDQIQDLSQVLEYLA